ncbi:MAG: hypothetical protein GY910_10830 [bacterium]|nr:hypothetical protein [bacterium]
MFFAPAASRAESMVMLLAPRVLETIGATTFDERGEIVGQSSLEIEAEASGLRRMRVAMVIEGGGTNLSQAILTPIEAAGAATGEIALRIVEERSQATTAEGISFPLLVIDHRIGRVSCYPADQASSAGQHVYIPGEDRVVNVPMQLLFMPLVRNEVDSLRFQIATCAPGPMLHQMIAVRGNKVRRDGRDVVEIEYRPDFGEVVAWLASRLLPSFSFWFDAKNGQYLGHRMPLHREGPEVLLVRNGLAPPDIGVD